MRILTSLAFVAVAAAPLQQAVALPLERPGWFTHSYSSGLDAPLSTVIRSEAEWVRLWRDLNARSGPKQPAPAIDFSNDMLLVAAMGQRPTGGYTIRIVSIRVAGPDLLATVVRTSPGRRCGTIQALTEPVDIVLVPRSERKVVWRFRDEATPC